MLAGHAFAVARGPPEQFRQEQPRIQPRRERMPSRAMVAANDVPGRQLGSDSDRDGLLSDIWACVSRYDALLLQRHQPFVEAAQQKHLAQQIQRLRRRRAIHCHSHLYFGGLNWHSLNKIAKADSEQSAGFTARQHAGSLLGLAIRHIMPAPAL